MNEMTEVNVDPYEDTYMGMSEEIVRLSAEIARLRGVEVERDLLLGDVAELRSRLDTSWMANAHLQDQLDGTIQDMSLMEARIAELMDDGS